MGSGRESTGRRWILQGDLFGRLYEGVGRGLPLLGTPEELAQRLLGLFSSAP